MYIIYYIYICICILYELESFGPPQQAKRRRKIRWKVDNETKSTRLEDHRKHVSHTLGGKLMVTLTPSCRPGWPRRSHVPILLCSKQQRYTELFAKSLMMCLSCTRDRGRPNTNATAATLQSQLGLHHLQNMINSATEPVFSTRWTRRASIFVRMVSNSPRDVNLRRKPRSTAAFVGLRTTLLPQLTALRTSGTTKATNARLKAAWSTTDLPFENTASVKAAKGQQWRRPSTRRKNSGHRNHRSVAWQNHGNIELK